MDSTRHVDALGLLQLVVTEVLGIVRPTIRFLRQGIADRVSISVITLIELTTTSHVLVQDDEAYGLIHPPDLNTALWVTHDIY